MAEEQHGAASAGPSLPNINAGNAGKYILMALLIIFIFVNFSIAFANAGSDFSRMDWSKVIYPDYLRNIINDFTASLSKPSSGSSSSGSVPSADTSLPDSTQDTTTSASDPGVGGTASQQQQEFNPNNLQQPDTTTGDEGADKQSSWFSWWYILIALLLVFGIWKRKKIPDWYKKLRGKKPGDDKHDGDGNKHGDDNQATDTDKLQKEIEAFIREELEENKKVHNLTNIKFQIIFRKIKMSYLLTEDDNKLTLLAEWAFKVVHNEFHTKIGENEFYKKMHEWKDLDKDIVKVNLAKFNIPPLESKFVLAVFSKELAEDESKLRERFIAAFKAAVISKKIEAGADLEKRIEEEASIPSFMLDLIKQIQRINAHLLKEIESIGATDTLLIEDLRLLFKDEHQQLSNLVKFYDALASKYKSEQTKEILEEIEGMLRDDVKAYENLKPILANAGNTAYALAFLQHILLTEYKVLDNERRVLIEIKTGINSDANIKLVQQINESLKENYFGKRHEQMLHSLEMINSQKNSLTQCMTELREILDLIKREKVLQERAKRDDAKVEESGRESDKSIAMPFPLEQDKVKVDPGKDIIFESEWGSMRKIEKVGPAKILNNIFEHEFIEGDASSRMYLNGPKLAEVLVSVDGITLFNAMDGRFFVIAKVGKNYLPFYRSSKGTSGKVPGHWYAFFGFTGSWVVKGTLADLEAGYYIDEVKRIQDLLNDNFILPDMLYGEGLVIDKNAQVLYDISKFMNFKFETGLAPIDIGEVTGLYPNPAEVAPHKDTCFHQLVLAQIRLALKPAPIAPTSEILVKTIKAEVAPDKAQSPSTKTRAADTSAPKSSENKPYDVKLNNGMTIPAIGFGTWELIEQPCTDAVKTALEVGYTHIDTAEAYNNEIDIAKAIKEIKRKKLFITSKVFKYNLKYADVIKSCTQSLKDLGTDYLDLYLVHWPNKSIPMEDTFKAMEKLHKDRKILAIGVSNFTIAHLKKALKIAKVPIVVNQVEFHPYLYQKELLDFCHANKIRIVAYSPLGRGKVYEDKVLIEIGKKYKKTAGQVSLRWLLQKGIIVIPKATTKDHIQENFEVFDFNLSQEDMARIDGLNRNQRFVDYPELSEFDMADESAAPTTPTNPMENDIIFDPKILDTEITDSKGRRTTLRELISEIAEKVPDLKTAKTPEELEQILKKWLKSQGITDIGF